MKKFIIEKCIKLSTCHKLMRIAMEISTSLRLVFHVAKPGLRRRCICLDADGHASHRTASNYSHPILMKISALLTVARRRCIPNPPSRGLIKMFKIIVMR